MSNYTDALEIRMKWLKWSFGEGDRYYHLPGEREGLAVYQRILGVGPTYYMNKRFCGVVDQARLTIPDDLAFDITWMISKNGFMWLEEPFLLPEFDEATLPNQNISMPSLQTMQEYNGKFKVYAVGWTETTDKKAIQIGFFLNRDLVKQSGFGMWAYLTLCNGDKVLERLRDFEVNTKDHVSSSAYKIGRSTDMLHEVRWFYTAMHLMSQKLATTVEHTVERGTRRRMEREKSTLSPKLRIVTLRRLEEARIKDPQGNQKDWQWCWRVSGFWREQWYPSEQVHKTIWIEEYIKGDLTKPLKPKPITVFVAGR